MTPEHGGGEAHQKDGSSCRPERQELLEKDDPVRAQVECRPPHNEGSGNYSH
jgi:hypothetical protein